MKQMTLRCKLFNQCTCTSQEENEGSFRSTGKGKPECIPGKKPSQVDWEPNPHRSQAYDSNRGLRGRRQGKIPLKPTWPSKKYEIDFEHLDSAIFCFNQHALKPKQCIPTHIQSHDSAVMLIKNSNCSC